MNTIKKGINFKVTPYKKLLLIHPATFTAYLSTLPVTPTGLVVFEFKMLSKLTTRALFATIDPSTEAVVIDNPKAINFIKAGKKTLMVIHLETFSYFFSQSEGWKAWKFKPLPSETEFAEIIPETNQLIRA